MYPTLKAETLRQPATQTSTLPATGGEAELARRAALLQVPGSLTNAGLTVTGPRPLVEPPARPKAWFDKV